MIAFLYSKTQATTYQAEAQMSFGDPFANLTLLNGGSGIPQESAAVRAANAAVLVTSPRLERVATKMFKNGPPPGCSIDASVLVETNNVAVDGTCRTAHDAALFTNTYAKAARKVGNAQARADRPCRERALRSDQAETDVVVFPVLWEEPWGLVPLEAMAVGVPVVATARGGSGEFLGDGENCLVYESAEDPAALATAVRRLADDRGLRDRLLTAGLATASRHDQASFTRAVIEEHERALARRRSGPPAE